MRSPCSYQLVLTSSLTILLGGMLAAQTPEVLLPEQRLGLEPTTSRGLFIGITRYDSPRIEPSPTSADDAVDLAWLFWKYQIIEAPNIRLGLVGNPFKPESRERLGELRSAGTPAPFNPLRRALLNELRSAAVTTSGESLFVVYASTHLVAADGTVHVLVSDSRPDANGINYATAVGLKDVDDILATTSASSKLVLLDGYRPPINSGGAATTTAALESLQLIDKHHLIFALPEPSIKLSAGTTNSPFTKSLFDGWHGSQGVDGEGFITISSLADFAGTRAGSSEYIFQRNGTLQPIRLAYNPNGKQAPPAPVVAAAVVPVVAASSGEDSVSSIGWITTNEALIGAVAATEMIEALELLSPDKGQEINDAVVVAKERPDGPERLKTWWATERERFVGTSQVAPTPEPTSTPIPVVAAAAEPAATPPPTAEPVRATPIATPVEANASTTDDANILTVDESSGTPKQIASIELSGKREDDVTAVSISPDGNLAIIGYKNGRTRLWNLLEEPDKPKDITDAGSKGPHITAIAFSPDSEKAAIGFSNGRVLSIMTRPTFSDSTFGTTRWDRVGHSNSIRALDFANDSLTLLSISQDNIAIRGLYNDKKTTTAFKKRQGVLLAALSGAVETALVVYPKDRSRNDTELHVLNLSSGTVDPSPLQGHDVSITALAISRDGSIGASGDRTGNIIIWDINQMVPILMIKGHKDKVESLSLSEDGKWLLSSGNHLDKQAHLWNLLDGQHTAIIKTHGNSIPAAAIGSSGTTGITGDTDDKAFAWDFTQIEN